MNTQAITTIDGLNPSYISPDENSKPTAVIISIDEFKVLATYIEALRKAKTEAERHKITMDYELGLVALQQRKQVVDSSLPLSKNIPNKKTLQAFKEAEKGKLERISLSQFSELCRQ